MITYLKFVNIYINPYNVFCSSLYVDIFANTFEDTLHRNNIIMTFTNTRLNFELLLRTEEGFFLLLGGSTHYDLFSPRLIEILQNQETTSHIFKARALNLRFPLSLKEMLSCLVISYIFIILHRANGDTGPPFLHIYFIQRNFFYNHKEILLVLL